VTPFVVGLTGGIGSGKSTVAELFAARGVPIVDTDAIAHELTAAGGAALPAIAAEFGEAMIGADGALDRSRMRAAVFADEAARARLEAILHPRIAAIARQRLCAASAPYLLLVVPLLVETGALRESMQRVLVVDCADELRLARVQRRSALAAAEVRAMMAAQAGRAERLAIADDVLANDGDLATLAAGVDRLHRRYLALAAGQPVA
jgi:dephospho-CoA kinase